MSQHDQVIANDTGAAVRADINSALAALFGLSSGASAPSTTIAYQLWADTTSGLLKQRNAANTGWFVRGTLAETFVISRASNTILGAADHSKAFVATSSFTQTLTAAATLGDGWFAFYRVNSGVTITIDPNSSENIDGATTKTIIGPAAGVIFCNGSSFFTYGFDQPAASDTVAGKIELADKSEMEAGSDTTRAVTPGRQHFHPSAAKAWGGFTGSGVVTLGGSYNISSVTDVGTGQYTPNFTTPMADANSCVVACGSRNFGDTFTTSDANRFITVPGVATGSFKIQFTTNTPAFEDPAKIFFAVFGDM